MLIGYVIGPYRAKTIYDIRRNIIASEALGADLIKCGVFPYIPHKNTAFYDGLAKDSFFLDGNLELIKRGVFDLAVVGHGWNRSDGSQDEIAEFAGMGVPVFFRENPAFFHGIEELVREARWAELPEAVLHLAEIRG